VGGHLHPVLPAVSAPMHARGAHGPGHVGVVGAGMVGLATAWFLQERGVQVTVLDRARAGAGASWGNAGWLTPALTTPLPHPSVLTYGVRALLSPSSPVYVPLKADPRLLRFVTSFARHSTHRRWNAGMRLFAPMNQRALAAFDELTGHGVAAETIEADPFLACFNTEAERAEMLAELDSIRHTGQEVKAEPIDGEAARRLEPALSERVGAAIRIHGQRYLNPPAFVEALADAVRRRGGDLVADTDVSGLREHGAAVTVDDATGRSHRFDAVVLATGATLDGLARPFGVRRRVQAGRGYSFSVAAEQLPAGPLYFPAQRVACTPLGDRLRIAGMMEFRRPDEPLDPRRIGAVVDAVRPFLSGVDLDDRQDEWVGSRPCTGDGLPLLGRTRSARVFVSGGHGMWGIALGPVTGMLLAQAVLDEKPPPELRPFDPLR
jgi:D-amino-acid dehydrogenase